MGKLNSQQSIALAEQVSALLGGKSDFLILIIDEDGSPTLCGTQSYEDARKFLEIFLSLVTTSQPIEHVVKTVSSSNLEPSFPQQGNA